MWFTQPGTALANQIGRITPAGTIKQFSTGISPAAGVHGIAPGPSGDMWFGELAGNRIGRIATGAPPLPNRARIITASTAKSVINVSVRVPGAGIVSVLGESAPASSTPLCWNAQTATKAATYRIKCSLLTTSSPTNREALSVRLKVLFTPTGGTPSATARTVKIKKN